VRRRGAFSLSTAVEGIAADPVLGAAELARGFVAAPAARQELGVHLAQQPVRERESPTQSLQSVVERGHAVRDLDHVLDRRAGNPLQFEQQEVGEGGLRSFDLGGQDRFLADVGVEEQRRVGQEPRQGVQSPDRHEGPLQRFLEGSEVERRLRR
jgi:hypothetical protein